MIFIRCPDKFIVGCVHQIPQPTDRIGYVIHIFLGRDSRILGFQFNLLPMLVGSRLEKNIVPFRTFESGNTVCQNDLIAITDMRFTGCICDRCRNVIFWF